MFCHRKNADLHDNTEGLIYNFEEKFLANLLYACIINLFVFVNALKYLTFKYLL
jgi:hypothetical protein